MRRELVALLHAGYWGLYVLLLALIFVMVRLPERPGWPLFAALVWSPIAALLIAPNVAAFYTSYALLFPRLLARRRIGGLIVAGLAVCLAAGALGLGVLALFFGVDQPVFASATELGGLWVSLATLAAIHVTIALVMRGFVNWYGDIKVKEALTRKTHEVELALVRARLDPHFLFNTLNNLDVLIARDPAIASEYLNKLSDIMRFVLYEARGERIPLADELQYIDKYIALERIRTRRAGYVVHEVTGDPARPVDRTDDVHSVHRERVQTHRGTQGRRRHRQPHRHRGRPGQFRVRQRAPPAAGGGGRTGRAGAGADPGAAATALSGPAHTGSRGVWRHLRGSPDYRHP